MKRWLIGILVIGMLVALIVTLLLVSKNESPENKTQQSGSDLRTSDTDEQKPLPSFQYYAWEYGWGDVLIGLISSYCILSSLGLPLHTWEWHLPEFIMQHFDCKVKCIPFDHQTMKLDPEVNEWHLCNQPLALCRQNILKGYSWNRWIEEEQQSWLPLPRRIITNIPWYVIYCQDQAQTSEDVELLASHLCRQFITTWAPPKQHVTQIVAKILAESDTIVHIRSGDFYSAMQDGHKVFSDDTMKHFMDQVKNQVVDKHTKKGVYVAADSAWALNRVPESWKKWTFDNHLPSHSCAGMERENAQHLRTVVEFLLFFYAPVVVCCRRSNFSKVGCIANESAARFCYDEYSHMLKRVRTSDLFEKEA